jgi:hypothetical protein
MEPTPSDLLGKAPAHRPFAQTFFHGTKADLRNGELIQVGFASNFGQDVRLRHVYLSATLDAAVWGAELAAGSGQERIYLVEPTGTLEDDPNLTDKKFPGNPTLSYRSQQPLKVVGGRHSRQDCRLGKQPPLCYARDILYIAPPATNRHILC